MRTRSYAQLATRLKEAMPWASGPQDPPQMSDSVMVFVKAPSGDCSTFDDLKEGTDTISTIKAKFHEKEGVPPEKQKLLFNGEELKDDLILSEDLAYQSSSSSIL